MVTPAVRGDRSLEKSNGFDLIEVGAPAPGALTIPHRATFGTALEGRDHTQLDAPIVEFDAGETRRTVTQRRVGDGVLGSGTVEIPRDLDDAIPRVDARGDEVPEGSELADPVLDLPPAIVGGHGGRLTIIDDDVSPIVTVIASPVVELEENAPSTSLPSTWR